MTVIVILAASLGLFLVADILQPIQLMQLKLFNTQTFFPDPVIISTPSPSPAINLLTPPVQKILQNNYHIFQTFNNCGPAALSMALSYYGINASQQTLGDALRPYQIPGGDNDDKSVTLSELAEKSTEYGFIAYHRPNGSITMLKQFITYDLPIITRTWTKTTEDIGHFRVVKGFDDTTEELIQDDSLQGKNLRFSYSEFNALWDKFNFEYLVLVPADKLEIVETILGTDVDTQAAWTRAVKTAQDLLLQNPTDITARFNLSVALYHIRQYQEAVVEFEKVENALPFRTLWYQIEPIDAYYQLGNFDRVFAITDKILNNHNRAFSELYLIRGDIYKQQGNIQTAISEYEKAVFYNRNLKKAQEALNSF